MRFNVVLFQLSNCKWTILNDSNLYLNDNKIKKLKNKFNKKIMILFK